jgi:hypothetical protein
MGMFIPEMEEKSISTILSSNNPNNTKLKTMKKAATFLLILLSWQLSAQLNPEKIKLGVTAGYAFYDQKDLKDINREIIAQLPFEARIIDNFEPVFYFGGYVQYELSNRFSLGPNYEYHYTGSRLGIKDYSGTYSFDQYVNAHQIGLKFNYSLMSFQRFIFETQLGGGACFTDWRMDTNLEIGEDGEYPESQLEKLKGHSWYVSPGLNFGYRLISQVTLTGSATYSFDIARKYKYLKNKNVNVINSPDWSGFKLSVGIEFNLDKPENKPLE